MATQHIQLTPHTDQTPAVVEVERELSGAQWCARFPGSASIDDLEAGFRAGFEKFKSAMEAAGISVRITVTYRPEKRAFLMHYCAKVASGAIAPEAVPNLDGVSIKWNHGSVEKSRVAAQSMADTYGIVYPPAYPTRHSLKLAVDMSLSNFDKKTVKDADGNDVQIKKESDLYAVGVTFGVNKLIPDHPHWSDNGH